MVDKEDTCNCNGALYLVNPDFGDRYNLWPLEVSNGHIWKLGPMLVPVCEWR